MRRALRALTAVSLLAFFLTGCAGPPVRENVPSALPEEAAHPELKLATAGGLPEVGRRLADLLRSRFPDAQWGRLALGWDPHSTWLYPVGKGFSGNWPSCVLATDLGLAGTRAEEVYIQLDPSYFRALLWLQPSLDSSGSLAALSLELRSIGPGPAWNATIPCDPPLALSRQAPKGRATPLPQPWLVLQEQPRAMAWEAGLSQLWIASSDKISRLDYATKKGVQKWNLPLSSHGAGRPQAVLSDLSEESSARMGWFDLERGQGRVYEKGAGDHFEPAKSIDGYPFTERVLRFIKAPYDGQQGVFLIQDFKGQELSRCVDIARFMGPGGSHFGLLDPDGTVKVLKGSDLSVVNGPVSFQASSITGLGGLLLAASALPPFEVKAYRLSPRGAWEEAWSSPELPAAATALCTGEPGGSATLFAAVPVSGGSNVYAIPVTP
jgi:hypothetical protein